MAYRWRQDGPAFEFPTPFGTENRFLTLRGYALIVLAVIVVLVALFAGAGESDRPVVVLEKLPEPGSVWPHVFAALVLAVWGGLDLYQAAGQRLLLLAPGQPASLVPEVSREATGTSSGAPWLTQALSRGMAAPGELTGPYLGLLKRLGPDLASAPRTLHDYLRTRLSYLALGAGLLVPALVALLWPQQPAAALVALLVLALGAAVIVKRWFDVQRMVLPPWAVGLVVAVGVAGAGVLLRFGGEWPLVDKLVRFSLPAGAVVLLANVLLFELMGLLAGRAQVDLPRPAKVGHEDVALSFDAHPVQLMREIDRELDRRWTDGVPNRRYVWMPPRFDAAAAEVGNFVATVLEESQPMVPPAGKGGAAARGSRSEPASRRAWLLALDALGLLWSVAGGLLWARAAWQHMHDSAALWTTTTAGLACLLAGGWAQRVAHLLWSRIEVDSTITWLEFKGSYFRLPGGSSPPPTADAAGWARAEVPVGVDEGALRCCVARARSMFYAAGTYELGSRTLLTLAPDPASTALWTTLAQDFTRKMQTSPAATAPAVLAARARARERRAAEQQGGSSGGGGGGPRRPARFCSACGTPVLAGARFCQQCGNVLVSE